MTRTINACQAFQNMYSRQNSQNTRNKTSILPVIRGSYKIPTMNITLTRVRHGAHLLRLRTRQEFPSRYHSTPKQKSQAEDKTEKEKNGAAGGDYDGDDCGRKEEKQGIQTEKEETKLYLFTDVVFVYEENSKGCSPQKSLATIKSYKEAVGQEITMKN